MANLPPYVKSHRLARKGFSYDHHFCSYCGKELTKLNLKNGKLQQSQHFICETENGLKIRLCWRRAYCEKRRDERNEKRR